MKSGSRMCLAIIAGVLSAGCPCLCPEWVRVKVVAQPPDGGEVEVRVPGRFPYRGKEVNFRIPQGIEIDVRAVHEKPFGFWKWDSDGYSEEDPNLGTPIDRCEETEVSFIVTREVKVIARFRKGQVLVYGGCGDVQVNIDEFCEDCVCRDLLKVVKNGEEQLVIPCGLHVIQGPVGSEVVLSAECDNPDYQWGQWWGVSYDHGPLCFDNPVRLYLDYLVPNTIYAAFWDQQEYEQMNDQPRYNVTCESTEGGAVKGKVLTGQSTHGFPFCAGLSGVPEGYNVTFWARPDPGYEFVGWEGPGGDPEGRMLKIYNVDSDQQYTAVFSPIERYKITVDTEVLDWSGRNYCAGYVERTPGCDFAPDTTAWVKAYPHADCCWVFDHWEGDVPPGAEDLIVVVTMDSDKSVRAVFKRMPCPTETIERMVPLCADPDHPEFPEFSDKYGALVFYRYVGAEGWWFQEVVTMDTTDECACRRPSPDEIHQQKTPVYMPEGRVTDQILNPGKPALLIFHLAHRGCELPCTNLTYQTAFLGPTPATLSCCDYPRDQFITVSYKINDPSTLIVKTKVDPPGAYVACEASAEYNP